MTRAETMWIARTKTDLMIEVWEKLDCENVGAVEIEAIEAVIAGQYGRSAVDTPMMIARLLADEGAALRHSEIMAIFVARASDRPYDAALRNILNLGDLKSTARTLRDLENLRLKYNADNDREGLRLVREMALRGKKYASEESNKNYMDVSARQINAEIVQWFRIWLETPEVFESWIDLRQRSAEFVEKFGKIEDIL